jgi:ABC-type dipeptide/oligopeptide/nickel transport system permease subunit
MPEPSAGTLIEVSEETASTTAPETKDVRTGRSPGQVAWARLKQDKVAIVCSVIILFFLLVAIFAPLLVSLEAVDPITGAKADVGTVHTELVDFNGLPTVGPSSAHWLGVEPRLGRDLFARWAYGARRSSSASSPRSPRPSSA